MRRTEEKKPADLIVYKKMKDNISIYRERERERERELQQTQHWTTSGENCNCPERDLNPRPPDH